MIPALGVLLLLGSWLTNVWVAAEGRRMAAHGYAGDTVPRRDLLRAQLVGTALNRVLPVGAGVLSTHLRVLQRRGHPTRVVGACLSGYALAGLLAHVVLSAAAATAIVTGLALLPLPNALPTPSLPLAVGTLLLAVATFFLVRRRVMRRVRDLLVALVSGLREVRTRPAVLLRVAMTLVVAQLAMPAALVGALLATGSRVPVLSLVALFAVTSSLTSALPAPAGTGPVEVGLLGGLVVLGTGLGHATAAVALFRLVTHWLPVPIGCLLAGRSWVAQPPWRWLAAQLQTRRHRSGGGPALPHLAPQPLLTE